MSTPFPVNYSGPFDSEIPSAGLDKNGIQWTSGLKGDKVYIASKTDSIFVERSPKEKSGAYYSYFQVSVDEAKYQNHFG